MRLDVVTIFPEYLEPLNVSLVGKARARGRLDVHVHDLRDWTHDRHNTVDDTPYGGGPGMVMKTGPWGEALDEALADGYEAGAHSPVLVVPTPSGRPFTQELAVELSERPWLIFTPARYEGIDRRVMDEYATRIPVVEVSIGDYVLAGGEAAVLVITEAVARLLPGCSAMPSRTATTPSHPAPWPTCSKARSTRSLPSGADGASPTCCSAAITAGSHAGDGTRRSGVRRSTGPISSSVARRPASTRRTARSSPSSAGPRSPGADFGAGPTPWKNRAAVRPACAPATGGKTPARCDQHPNFTLSRR